MGRQIKAITGFEPKEEGTKGAFLSASPSQLFMISGFKTLTASVKSVLATLATLATQEAINDASCV